jgi:hypothetical protein
MAAPIETIVAMLIGQNYRISQHIWQNYILGVDRPEPDQLVNAIIEDDPTVESHDRNNPRGSSCDVRVVDRTGRAILVTIGYETRPITLVTAYFEGGQP